MRLAYTDEGPGPAVVLLHGFPLGREMWKEQLVGIGSMYRVIAPDLRGHGESPAPEGDYTIDGMADDVIELLDTLSLTVPVVVGGLSMGGYVALSLVARYPERIRALMLMDTRAGADSPEAAQKREEQARAVLAAGNPGSVVEAMIPRLFARITLEERPGAGDSAPRVDGAHDRQGSRRGPAGHGQSSRPACGPGEYPGSYPRSRRRGGCGHAPGRGPGDGRRDPRYPSGGDPGRGPPRPLRKFLRR